MPQQPQNATPTSDFIPGVTHPVFEDDDPNFWEQNFGRRVGTDNPSYVSTDPPAFLKQGLDTDKVKEQVKTPTTREQSLSVAEVEDEKPYEITIFHPEDYGTSVRNHELTHSFQDTRSPDISVSTGHANVEDIDAYNYGWVKGLEDARKKGKTISDFNMEQQADMVEDYKKIHDYYLDKAKKGTITPKDEKVMYRVQQAYHPFIEQLAKMPSKDQKVSSNPLLQLVGYSKAPTIDIKSTRVSAPPGLPSYDTPGLGVLPADPLMGGKSQPTPTPKLSDLSSGLRSKKKKTQ